MAVDTGARSVVCGSGVDRTHAVGIEPENALGDAQDIVGRDSFDFVHIAVRIVGPEIIDRVEGDLRGTGVAALRGDHESPRSVANRAFELDGRGAIVGESLDFLQDARARPVDLVRCGRDVDREVAPGQALDIRCRYGVREALAIPSNSKPAQLYNASENSIVFANQDCNSKFLLLIKLQEG